MCCEYTDYAASMLNAKKQILDEVLPTLESMAFVDPKTYLLATFEILNAIELDSFNKYVPQNPAVWQMISWPIRTRTSFDDERVYMLAAVLQHLIPAIMGGLEEKLCRRMLGKSIPIRV